MVIRVHKRKKIVEKEKKWKEWMRMRILDSETQWKQWIERLYFKYNTTDPYTKHLFSFLNSGLVDIRMEYKMNSNDLPKFRNLNELIHFK